MKTSGTTRSRLISSLMLVSAIASIAPSADAFDERRHYSYCIDLVASSLFKLGGNDSTSGAISLACPVPDNASIPHWNISTIHVYNQDLSTSAGVSASRCIEYSNATGANCGAAVTSSISGTGINTLVPLITPASFATDWTAVFGHFAYINVVLPAKSGGSTSKLKGYWVTD